MRIVLLFAFTLALSACHRSPYEGYKEVSDDVHLHFVLLGEGADLPSDSDSVLVRLRMGWHGGPIGGLFSTEDHFAVKDLRSGPFVPALQRLHEGDSMSLIAPAGRWPWAVITAGKDSLAPDTGMVRVEVGLIGIRTPAMVRAEKERLRRNDPLGFERRLIAAFLEGRSEPFIRWGTSDVYYHIEGQAPDTARVQIGEVVRIRYKGRRLEDGVVFDDPDLQGEDFEFRYGDKDQVIHGIEVAVLLLRPGQTGTFILPSEEAFGARGIVNVLEPYTPVLYTVELNTVELGVSPRAARE